MDRIIQIPEVRRRLGAVKFCSKALKPQAPLKKEEKKEVPKPAQKPKDDGGELPKKKEENPLDLLPPSKFVLPDFKTYFVNLADKRGEGMKHFFENYDPEGYCIYYAKYDKYEGEGTVLYQTSNLMNGFL
jgi:elongation factor 1-gamma